MVAAVDAYEVPEAPREAGAGGNRSGAYSVREHRKRKGTKQMPEIAGGRLSEESGSSLATVCGSLRTCG
jgi:hypothetical protein